MEFKLVKQLEYCTIAPFLTLCLLSDTMSYWTYKFNTPHRTGHWDGCVIEQSDNQCFYYSPQDSSRQEGDQLLISGSPQTTFGRIGEWASGNLQPCIQACKTVQKFQIIYRKMNFEIENIWYKTMLQVEGSELTIPLPEDVIYMILLWMKGVSNVCKRYLELCFALLQQDK